MRCVMVGLCLFVAGAVAAAESDVPAPTGDAAPTATEPAAKTDADNAEATNEREAVAEVEAGNERFRYKVTFTGMQKVAVDDIECSHGRYTGSKRRQTYCRSKETARAEREAAREFLLEAMRNKN